MFKKKNYWVKYIHVLDPLKVFDIQKHWFLISVKMYIIVDG